ncbi:MAG: GtrA family protein [Lachnospiraceae bacterium]|nr:GtrA family protein [Lachnospiraceae bacterium]
MSEEQNKVDANGADNESYFSYYVFVFISAIIGFIAVFFLAGVSIDRLTNSGGLSFLSDHRSFASTMIALVAVIIFLFIAIRFRKQLKGFFLSELFMYLYMGVLTTVVNIVSFEVLRNALAKSGGEASIGWKVAEIVAFLIALIFAFVVNKVFVFRSLNLVPTKLFSELGMFFGARVITEVINFAIMWFMIDKKGMNETFTKIVASVVVIVLNYIFSKYIIFKKNAKEA